MSPVPARVAGSGLCRNGLCQETERHGRGQRDKAGGWQDTEEGRWPVTAPHRLQTRWNDNDVYGHANNGPLPGEDTVINAWMIEHATNYRAGQRAPIGCTSRLLHVESAEYPDTLEIGLRVGTLGTSSVTWEPA